MIVLVRHGETAWSRDGRHTGRTDVPLTDTGRQQARAAGPVIAEILDGATPHVLCSPRRRAVDTATLAGLPEPAEIVDDLGEWDYGDYEGVTTDEIRRTVPGWTVWTHPCPGGEDATAVTVRADRVLDAARHAEVTQPVVLVGHGHFSRVLAARWIGRPAGDGIHVAHGAGAVTVLGYEHDRRQLVHVNLRSVR